MNITPDYFQALNPDQIIPKNALDILPFTKEPPSQWTHDTDLYKYLYEMFNVSSEVVSDEGEKIEANYSFFGPYIFEESLDTLRDVEMRFTKCAREGRPNLDLEQQMILGLQVLHHLQQKESPGKQIPENLAPALGFKSAMQLPEFWDDANFGLFGKYKIAWYAIVRSLLQESGFFSVAHLLEADSELYCSELLASNLYYKQAIQVLRGFLEHNVVQLYLCNNPAAFKLWLENDYRVPQFRGRKSMLADLVSREIFSESLAEYASEIYGELNGAIHGSRDFFIHGEKVNGDTRGIEFNREYFDRWCEYFSRVTYFGIQAMRISVLEWAKIKSTLGAVCSICHSGDHLEIEDTLLGAENLEIINCTACGNSMTFISGRESFGVL